MAFLVLGIFVIIPGLVSAADSGSVYVSTQGNDSWDGLSAVYNNSTNSGPKATIKNATSIVATNGTVHIASGTYRENQINLTKSMKIIGENKNNTFVNGTNSGPVFNIFAGISVNIENLTITNGNATLYQNITIPGAYTRLIYNGGAINNWGMLTIKNSAFKNNGELGGDDDLYYQIHTYGGAIYNYFGGTLSIDNCVFINNTSFYGGAIVNNGTSTIKNSVFTSNSAYGGGGAVYNPGTLTISNSLFFNNALTSQGGGGAILNEGVVVIDSSTFSGNTGFRGGAIENTNYLAPSNLTVTNSNFTSNSGNYGGAISSVQGFMAAINNSFINNTACVVPGAGDYFDNTARTAGGAIYGSAGIVNFNRFVGNYAQSNNANIFYSQGEMDARFNWWGSNSPNMDHKDFTVSGGVFTYDPWMVLTVNVSPVFLQANGTSNVTADLLHDSNGNFHDRKDGMVPYNGSANFAADEGTIVDAFFVDGVARTAIHIGGAQGRVNVSATVDNVTASSRVNVGLAIVDPSDGDIVPKNYVVTVTFSDFIKIGPGYGNVWVTDKNGNRKSITLTIKDNILTITPVGDWGTGGLLTLTLPNNAVTSIGGDLLTQSMTSTFIVKADTVYVSNQGNDSWDGMSKIFNNTSGSGPKATIKNAISILAENGTIYVASGTYNENQIYIKNSMTIIGEGRGNTTINGANSGTIFSITSNATVTIKNLTLKNGKGVSGGAIYNEGTLTVNNVLFTNNTAGSGGAIYNLGTLTVDKSVFTNNGVTSGGGGAIYNRGTVTVNNSEFTNNTAIDVGSGGAIWNNGSFNVNNSEFKGNYADGEGGSIENQGTMNIVGSTFTNNKVIGSLGQGGTILNRGVLTIEGSSFTNSSSTGSGGTICNYQDASLAINNSTFTNNTAPYNGGAICNFGSAVAKITNSTFIGNNAGVIDGGNIIIDKSTFIGNIGLLNNNGVAIISNSVYLNNTGSINNIYGSHLTIINSTFSGNTLGTNGLIWNAPRSWQDAPVGVVTIINSVITGNHGTGSRFGIDNFDGIVTVTGSVISNNTVAYPDAQGSFIWNDRGEVNLSFNVITNNDGLYLVWSRVSSVYADNNWWGDNDGTNRVSINGRGVSRWLVLTVSVDQVVNFGQSVQVTVNMWYNNLGEYLDPANGHIMDGVLVDITSDMGTFLDSAVKFIGGMAQAVFTPNSVGSGKISVSVGQTIIELLIQVLNLNHTSDNNTSENNTDNNTTENSTTNTTTNSSSSSDGNQGGSSPGTGDGSPSGNDGSSPESVPQEPDNGQSSGNSALSTTGQSGEESEGNSVGESGQNQKSYEITPNTTGQTGLQEDTTLFAVVGIILLLLLVGVGFYFKK